MALTINGTDGIELNTDTGKLKVGTGDDLEIFHDGSNSYIKDTGTGALCILGSEIQLTNAANTENLAVFKNDGACELFQDGTKVFNTAGSGVDITLTSADTSGPPDKSLLLYNGNDGANTMAGIRFVATSTGSNDHYIYGKRHNAGNGQDLIIAQNSNERVRFIESGGMTFNGDTAAANALDDYEEGIFTINGSNSITLHDDYNTGSYIKIGKLVHCQGLLRVNNGNSNSHFGFHLPFTAVNGLTDAAERSVCSCSTHNWNLPSSETNIAGVIEGNNTQCNFFMSRDDQGRDDLLAYGDAYMDFSITYRVA